MRRFDEESAVTLIARWWSRSTRRFSTPLVLNVVPATPSTTSIRRWSSERIEGLRHSSGRAHPALAAFYVTEEGAVALTTTRRCRPRGRRDGGRGRRDWVRLLRPDGEALAWRFTARRLARLWRRGATTRGPRLSRGTGDRSRGRRAATKRLTRPPGVAGKAGAGRLPLSSTATKCRGLLGLRPADRPGGSGGRHGKDARSRSCRRNWLAAARLMERAQIIQRQDGGLAVGREIFSAGHVKTPRPDRRCPARFAGRPHRGHQPSARPTAIT